MDSPEAYGNAVTSYRRSDVGPLASRLERFGATILDALIFSTILNLLAPACGLASLDIPIHSRCYRQIRCCRAEFSNGF